MADPWLRTGRVCWPRQMRLRLKPIDAPVDALHALMKQSNLNTLDGQRLLEVMKTGGTVK